MSLKPLEGWKPYITERTRGGVTRYQAAIREAYAKRTYFGTYPSRADADAAIEYFRQTGLPPGAGMFNAQKPGPKGPRKRRDTPTPRPTRKSQPQASRVAAPSHAETRVEMLRRLYRAKFSN